jgi:hypothetical protein
VVSVALPWSRARRLAARRRRGLSTGWYEANDRRRVIWQTVAAIVAAVALGELVLTIGVAAVVLPAAAAVLAAIVWRPQIGLYAAVALVNLFEMTSADPLMAPGRYLHYGLQSSLGVSGFIASPLELLLLFTLAVWLVKGLVQRNLGYRGGDLGWPTALFFASLVAGLVRGAAGQGDMYVAFWEVRSLLYLGVTYVLAANLIRTRRDVGALVTVFLVTNGLYAFEGAIRYVLMIRTGWLNVAPEFTYSHEVVIFLAVVMLQALAQIVVGGPLWRRIFGAVVALMALFTMLVSGRRAGSIALAIAFVLMALPWLVRHRKAVLLILLPGLFAGAIYLPIFWNNTGIIGQPARAVRSLIEPDARDASSNEYRDQEAINVRATIYSDPLLGVGFGREFLFVVPLADLSWWPFWHYQPHHNILWVWLKVGAPGFTIFCMLMFGSLALASSRALTLKDPTLITFAYVGIASVVTSLVFCYVDLGLTNGRVTVLLGAVLGVLAVLRQIDEAPEPVKAKAGARMGAAGRPTYAEIDERPTTERPAHGGAAGPGTARPTSPRPAYAPNRPRPAPEPTPAGAGRF